MTQVLPRPAGDIEQRPGPLTAMAFDEPHDPLRLGAVVLAPSRIDGVVPLGGPFEGRAIGLVVRSQGASPGGQNIARRSYPTIGE